MKKVIEHTSARREGCVKLGRTDGRGSEVVLSLADRLCDIPRRWKRKRAGERNLSGGRLVVSGHVGQGSPREISVGCHVVMCFNLIAPSVLHK